MIVNKGNTGKLDKADDLVKKGGQVFTVAGVIIGLLKAFAGSK